MLDREEVKVGSTSRKLYYSYNICYLFALSNLKLRWKKKLRLAFNPSTCVHINKMYIIIIRNVTSILSTIDSDIYNRHYLENFIQQNPQIF